MASDYRAKLSAVNHMQGADETAEDLEISLQEYEGILMGYFQPTQSQLEYIDNLYEYFTEVRPAELLETYTAEMELYEAGAIDRPPDSLSVDDLVGYPIFASDFQHLLESGELKYVEQAMEAEATISLHLVATTSSGDDFWVDFLYSGEDGYGYDEFIAAFWAAFRIAYGEAA